MESTDNQRAEFRAAFSTRRKRQLAASVPLIGIVIAFAFMENRADGTVFGLPLGIAGPVFFAIVAGGLIFSLRNWRCPACNKYLGRSFNPKHCQNCGVQLSG